MKIFLSIIAGFILGAVTLAYAVGAGAHQFMIQETKSPLGFKATVDAISTTVTGKGWKLPKVYRLDKTMEEHGYKTNAVAVLELCHPEHAYKILQNEDSLMVTPFMPCRISVYQKNDGEVVIARMNSGLMSRLFHADVASVMAAATGEVEGIIAAAVTTPPNLAAAAPAKPRGVSLESKGNAFGGKPLGNRQGIA